MSDDSEELAKIEAERWWKFREKSVEFSKEYGVATVRSLILINGGAIIALLSFASNIKKDNAFGVELSCLRIAVAAYLIGLCLGCLIGVMGYFNFQSNALTVPDPNNLHQAVLEKKVIRNAGAISTTSIAAIVAAVASFLAFTFGSIAAMFSLVTT